jgi:hypothetical protein
MRKGAVLLVISYLLFTSAARSQGCVAIRNITGFGQFAELGYNNQTKDKWSLSIDNRQFEAYTFLQGKVKITPKDLDTGVTLHEWTTNFELTRLLDNGWSISLDMPITANGTQGSLEHASHVDHQTHAFGLGDMRLTVYKWLFGEKSSGRGNIQLGVGIKFPTGNYRSEDYFYDDPNDLTAKVSAPVNVAIQLGDGGTGITTQLNAFYNFSQNVNVYANLFYLISPKDQNGVAAWPPGLLPPDAIALFHAATYDVNSVPDSYTYRAGVNLLFGNLVATGGLRYEGVPAHDLFGSDDGLRRAGHIFSVEPGLQYKFTKSFLYAFVTVPVARATILTVPDERMAAITGTPASITPGHFANYILSFGYSFAF